MKKQVIEVLDKEHGEKVIEYWESRGVDIGFFLGTSTRERNSKHRYYGIINGYFCNYTLDEVNQYNATIITLPEPEWKPKFGEKVLVWNDNEYKAKECIFLTEIDGALEPYVTVHPIYEDDYNNGVRFPTCNWQNMKPLPQTKEVTMQEIAEKFGVDVEQLKIKK